MSDSVDHESMLMNRARRRDPARRSGFGGGLGQIAHASDAIAADGDICDPTFPTRTVVNCPALNNNVERRIAEAICRNRRSPEG